MTVEDDDLGEATRQIAAREPIFHRPQFGTTREDFERMLTHDFWETGASGSTYGREVILDILEQRHLAPGFEELTVSEFRCQRIGNQHYLATY